jgi:hypothetical protein
MGTRFLCPKCGKEYEFPEPLTFLVAETPDGLTIVSKPRQN